MARSDSIQKRLEKIRPPRVQLTYDVQVGDAIEQKEIPFVAGVLGDFSGDRGVGAAPARLRDRKFVGVSLDNFDDVMQAMAPAASFRVRDRLRDDGSEFAVRLAFAGIDDFRPESVVQQVEPLRRLLEARTRLSDLRNKLAGNERLEDLLVEVLANTDKLKAIGHEAGAWKD